MLKALCKSSKKWMGYVRENCCQVIAAVVVLFSPCFSQSIGAAICEFLAHSSRPFWRRRSCWAKASYSRDQVVGGSRLLDGCIERAWTDSISVSKPLTCPWFCNCKYAVVMNYCIIFLFLTQLSKWLFFRHILDYKIGRFFLLKTGM
jgi:hypothetical protein